MQAQTPIQPTQITPSSRLGAAFWIAIIGAIFGIILGVFLLAIASISVEESLTYAKGIGLIVFSVVGILGALRIINDADTPNALVMFIAGVGVLVCWFPIGILSAILFFVGGVLILVKKG
jgi:hypothetical protein